MKKEMENYFNGGKTLSFLLIFFLILGVSTSYAISIANAIPIEPTEEERTAMKEKMDAMSLAEREAFMDKIKNERESPEFSNELREELEGQEAEKKIEERVNVARKHFEINQRKLRVVKSIATSTVSQLQLEGTDVIELRENLKIFERIISEIEISYKDYLNGIVVFKNGKGPDPGDFDSVLVNAQTKKQELQNFYQDTFRGSIENALIKNEEWKITRENDLKNKQ